MSTPGAGASLPELEALLRVSVAAAGQWGQSAQAGRRSAAASDAAPAGLPELPAHLAWLPTALQQLEGEVGVLHHCASLWHMLVLCGEAAMFDHEACACSCHVGPELANMTELSTTKHVLQCAEALSLNTPHQLVHNNTALCTTS